MNFSILNAFLADQRKAKQMVSSKLGIPEDIPARDWTTRYLELRTTYDASPFADIFRIHGFGLEFKVGDLYSDYDYSLTGLPGGFDSWRIFVYIVAGQFDNRGPDKHICDRLDEWFDELIRHGRTKQTTCITCGSYRRWMQGNLLHQSDD